MDLYVPVQRLLAYAARRPALGIEAVGRVGDRLPEALCDVGEVPFVVGDQRRAGLGGEAVGKVERAGSKRAHVIGSDLRSLATLARGKAPGPAWMLSVPASACDYAARPGSCRKPPGAV